MKTRAAPATSNAIAAITQASPDELPGDPGPPASRAGDGDGGGAAANNPGSTSIGSLVESGIVSGLGDGDGEGEGDGDGDGDGEGLGLGGGDPVPTTTVPVIV